jgi:hypothetical protein
VRSPKIPDPHEYIRYLNYEYYKAERERDFDKSEELYSITQLFIAALISSELYHAIRKGIDNE